MFFKFFLQKEVNHASSLVTHLRIIITPPLSHIYIYIYLYISLLHCPGQY